MNGYTLVTLIGHSGSGKSTFTGTLCHRLHKISERLGVSYAINWYRRDAISKIDEIIPTLAKGVNRIVVFEDASWGDRELDETEAKQLLARLTYVRHDLQAHVIFLFQVHYSKALGPFLRDGDVVAITSISHIEKENFLKTFGWDNKGIINKFFKKFGSMNAESYWYSELDEAHHIIYYAKAPFKLALVSDFNSLHFTQYPKESCGYCEPHFTDIEQGKIIDSATERELFAQIADSYSITKLRMCLRFFAYFRTGAACLEPKTKSVMARLMHYYERHPDEWKNISDELRIGKSVDHVLRNRGLAIRHTHEESRINKRAKRRLAERERQLKEQEQQAN
jgi:hypothetical protein